MLLIESTAMPGGGAMVRLEGSLIGPWVDEVKAVCDRHLAAYPAVSLDLSEVGFIDRRGVALVHGLRARGVRVAKCSGFAAEQLRSAGGDGDARA
jgi:hypothetical protein